MKKSMEVEKRMMPELRAQSGGTEMNILVFWDFLCHFAGQALDSASMLQVAQRR
jgi:hypothetical protein